MPQTCVCFLTGLFPTPVLRATASYCSQRADERLNQMEAAHRYVFRLVQWFEPEETSPGFSNLRVQFVSFALQKIPP